MAGGETPVHGRRWLGAMLRILLLLAVLLPASIPAPLAAAEAPGAGVSLPRPGAGSLAAGRAGENEAWFAVDSLNEGLDGPSGFRSPREALRALRGALADDDAALAARALNLDGVPADEQATRGPVLAGQLVDVMERALWLTPGDLPSRPDGASAASILAGNNGDSGPTPRRSVDLGSLDLDAFGAIDLRLERVRPADSAPVWVVAPDVVAHIPALYKAYGPGWLERQLPPSWRDGRLGTMPPWQWGALAVLLAGSVAAGWLLQRVTLPLLHRIHGAWTHVAVKRLRLPVGVATGALTFLAAHRSLLTLSGPVAGVLTPVAVIIVIAAASWAGLRLFSLLLDLARHRHFSRDIGEDSQEGQAFLTHLSVARRLTAFTVILVGLGAALAALGVAENLGLSLLASAGAVSVLLGLAARSTIGNVLAGVQIAITKPVRIGDLVMFQGDWGYVEDIAYTFLIIRTWDQKRVVVPLRVFLETPFENWSKNRQNMVMPIFIHCDYRVDVDDVRAIYEKMLTEHPDYDGGIAPHVHLIDSGPETIQLRFLCSADEPMKTWFLQQELRERMVAYIRTMADGDYLPRQRILLQNPDATGGGASDPQAEGEPVPETGPAPTSNSGRTGNGQA